MSLVRTGIGIWLLAGLRFAAVANAQEAAAGVSASALKACAQIETSTYRLACYDRLAGRAPSPVAAASSAKPPIAPPPPSTQSPSTASTSSGEPQKETFGKYTVEHPAPPKPPASFTDKVVRLGTSANGRLTVTLDRGGLWEIDEPDTVLANGDSVTIKRAALGSFLMTTPSGRTHRVRRLD
jgi:hypothetical protein